MSGDRRISKVKWDGHRVEITSKETWGVGNEREWTLRCAEAPDPAFPAALQALPPEIRKLLELPEHWAEGAFKVLSVSFSWSETTEVRGASICCRADLECATAPLIINTPHLPYDQYSEGGAQPTMPPALVGLLDEVEHQAERYINGARSQADLFEDEPAPPPPRKDAAAGERVEA